MFEYQKFSEAEELAIEVFNEAVEELGPATDITLRLEKLLSDIELELQDFPLALKLRDHIYQKYRDDNKDSQEKKAGNMAKNLKASLEGKDIENSNEDK